MSEQVQKCQGQFSLKTAAACERSVLSFRSFAHLLNWQTVKKFFLAATIMVLLGLGIFFVKRSFLTDPALEFTATDASANWLTYSNDRYGFHIKYPPEGWNIHQFPLGSIVTFENEASGFGLSIRWYPDSDADFAQLQNELQARGKAGVAKISGFDVRHVHEISGNSHGHLRIDGFYFPGPSGAYQITVSNTFTNNNEKLKESGLLIPLAREMIGTFGTNDIKRLDYLTYNDSEYHFSFTYPADWNLVYGPGFPRVSLSSYKPDFDYWIGFTVTPIKTISEITERFLKIGEKREYFDRKLLGLKYGNDDAGGYYFEKNGNLYDIHIFRIKGPRKPVDDILDSFHL